MKLVPAWQVASVVVYGLLQYGAVHAVQELLQAEPNLKTDDKVLRFSPEWTALGPFRIGTRGMVAFASSY
jgi:hypothetical protein